MGIETKTVSSTGARKAVKNQRYNLIPPRAVMELAKLYGRGAQKYAPNNFRLGYESSKSYAAGQRHAVLFWSGEDFDTEMGCHHLASFVWHCFTMLECNITHPEFDDRPYLMKKKAAPSEVPELLSIAPTPWDVGTLYRHDLIPMYPLAAVAEVFGNTPTLAVIKKEVTYGYLYARMQHHANLYWAGEDVDTDTGLPNMGWAAAYGLLLLELSLARPESDDRFLPAAPLGFDSVPKTEPTAAELTVAVGANALV
jgi:hypothetical protein